MIELKINNVVIDLNELANFPLNFSQADAREPSKRKRDSSKTIVLPGTQRNNTFFSSTYDLNLTDVFGDLVGFDFDPTLRYPAVVTRKGKVIFNGAANLTKVITRSDVTNGRINEFHVNLFSTLADVFQAFGDTLVSELGWEEYNDTLSIANIAATWTASPGTGIWWPLIDYGYTTDLRRYKTNELRPHVYAFEVIKKAFALGGFTISSVFLNTALFKRIAFGTGGGELITISDATAASRRVRYTGDGTATYALAPTFSIGGFFPVKKYEYTKTIPFQDSASLNMVLVNDTLLQFNEATGDLVISATGHYKLKINGTFPVSYSFTPNPAPGRSFNIRVQVRIFLDGAVLSTTIYDISTPTAGTTNVPFAIEQAIYATTGSIIRGDVQLITNETVALTGDPTVFNLSLDFNNTLNFDLTATDAVIVDGDIVEVARFLPEMKVSDFVNDFIAMFNLYFSDPDTDGNVVIEPMNSYFFQSDETDNWTDKLARDQDIEIEPASNIEGKTYRFRFAEDRDYYKKRYFDLYGHDYGDYSYNVPSTFKKGEKIWQTKIAQSCPVQIQGFDIIIPRIVKINESTLVASPHKGKPRIYFNNGVISSDEWGLQNSNTLAITAYTSYPQAHHLDNLTTATFDLNFGRPELVFYSATTYTDDNLYNRNYDTFVREMTGRDGKVVNAWFRLDERDFYKNFMRRLCNIDGVVYRKNLVKDCIANTNNLVKCELIRLVTANSKKNFQSLPPLIFTPSTSGVGGVAITSQVALPQQTLYRVDTASAMSTVITTLNPSQLPIGWVGEFIKINAGGPAMRISAGGSTGATINGAASVQFNNQYDTVRIRFDGTQFFIIK